MKCVDVLYGFKVSLPDYKSKNMNCYTIRNVTNFTIVHKVLCMKKQLLGLKRKHHPRFSDSSSWSWVDACGGWRWSAVLRLKSPKTRDKVPTAADTVAMSYRNNKE